MTTNSGTCEAMSRSRGRLEVDRPGRRLPRHVQTGPYPRSVRGMTGRFARRRRADARFRGNGRVKSCTKRFPGNRLSESQSCGYSWSRLPSAVPLMSSRSLLFCRRRRVQELHGGAHDGSGRIA
jgi:hypothetical protein